MAERRPWQSLHLFFEGPIYGEEADRLLAELVAPTMADALDAGEIDAFFFVRYFDGRGHLRLRFRPRNGAASGGSGLARELERAAAGSTLVTAFEWVPYEPEVARYGGPIGLGISEELFYEQSRTTLDLLKKVPPGDRASRLGKALLAQLVLLHVFLPDRPRATELVGRFGDAYLHQRTGDEAMRQRWIEEYRRGFDRQSDALAAYVEAAWAASDADEPLTAELDPFRRRSIRLRNRLRKANAEAGLTVGELPARASWPTVVDWLLPSYLHMMHNRMGVDLREECYLAVLTHATLGHPVVDAPTASDDPNSDSEARREHAPLRR